jgi:hypothetical protein
MPLAEFTSIVLIAPLVVTLLAATTLKEEVSRLRWALVAGGFAGTLVILRPGGTVFSWAILLPLALVVTNAWFQILTSRLARTEKPITMHFYTGWVGALVATIPLPFVWTRLPSWNWWALLCLMGFMGTVGHFFLILAYQRAPASTLTPYLYAQIAFAMSAAARVRPRARRRLARRHGAHRRLRRGRRVAHGARAARADRAGGVVTLARRFGPDYGLDSIHRERHERRDLQPQLVASSGWWASARSGRSNRRSRRRLRRAKPDVVPSDDEARDP